MSRLPAERAARHIAGRYRAAACWAALAACGALLCLTAPSASAARNLDTGFADPLYQSPGAATWLDRTVAANAELVRINVVWRQVVSGQPLNPRNPADPAYDFSAIDTAVNAASARGLEVLLTFLSAPDFAEGPDRPGNAAPGTWRPQPEDVEDFAFALASRYPQVSYIQAWNEPTLREYLTPQWAGGKARSPGVYRDLLNAAYKGIKAAGDAQVVTAGTAPYGDPPGGNRVRPLFFWRKVFCLKGRTDLRPYACGEKPRLDVLAHHPINTSGGPHRSAIHPDDASTPDLKNVRRILRKAERANRVAPNGRHQLWVTEFWWESNPPDDCTGIAEATHARWIQQALYLFWKQGARVAINLQIRDDTPGCGRSTYQTGIFFLNGTEKLAYTAFRFPFVTERQSRQRLRAWGKAPATGALRIERKAGDEWNLVKTLQVAAGDVFVTKLGLRGSEHLRARVGSDTSLVWDQG